jgi:serine/threonine protein kinase/SAM-dependent methyltransferase
MNKLRGEPNVVQLFEVEQSGNALLLGMQLCEGGTLRQYLTNAPKGRIASRDEIIRITRDITIGLGALRRLDLVHRDLKPSNVLFHGNKVLIGDFGMVARISEGDTATRVCGTIRYMAPEMIVQQNYDHRVDLWGLGLIVYEMMVGKHPFLEWADESTCDDVTDAMTKLLSAIVICRASGSNTTEILLPRGLPFQFMIGEDSPVRIMQGLLQESKNHRWSYEKLSAVLAVFPTQPDQPAQPDQLTPRQLTQHQTQRKDAVDPARADLSFKPKAPGSPAQRRRSMLRRNSASRPDDAVRRLLESSPISEVALGRDHLVVMYADDSCLEALRVLLKHKISSAPVLRGKRVGPSAAAAAAASSGTPHTGVVLGFVDVLDLVSIIIKYHQNPRLSAIDALVSKLPLACNFSGNNPYMRLEVSDSLTVADAMPLLIGGVKRLAVTDGKKGIVSVLTQSQLLRWLMGRLRELESNGGEGSISASSIHQKAQRSIESLGLCNYWHRKGTDGKARILVVRSDDTVASAFLLLAENHLSAAPVVDHVTGAIVGVFSASDVNKLPSFDEQDDGKDQEAAARVASAFGSLNKLNSTVLEYISNKQTKARGAITVVASDSMATVCKLLATHSIHRCYLVEKGDTPRPFGVVSIADVLHVIIKPCNVFDAAECHQANVNLEERMKTRFPHSLPYRHLFAADRGAGGEDGCGGSGARYLDDPFSPNACLHVLGHQLRHGNMEISFNVLAIPQRPFLLDSVNGGMEGEELQWPTRAVEKLASWAVRNELDSIRRDRLTQTLGAHQVCVMYRALDRPLWTAVRRAMQSNGFTQASIEPCQMYTLSSEVYATHTFWASTDTSAKKRDGYAFHALGLEHAEAVNATWKFRSESSLKKIQSIIASGRTMAAFANDNDEVPVSWMVTYENGSMGMLFTQREHRRRGLASAVAKRLVQDHHLPTPESRPFLYIEVGNHASMRLFGERLGFQAQADVAWVRWIKKSEDSASSTTTTSAASETKQAGGLAGTRASARRAFRPKGGTAISHSENVVKWEAWYGAAAAEISSGDGDGEGSAQSLALPPWDTDGRPCFALRELVESLPSFKKTYPRAIDIGCGTGSNAIWLANQCGFRDVVGIDISPKAIVRAQARARDARAEVELQCVDIFDLPVSLAGAFDFLVDVQTFHAIYHLDAARLVRSMASLLRNRGLALVVTGNSGEAEKGNGMGPSTLSQKDLVTYFCGGKLFRVAEIREARFDPTPAYGEEPPLCWVALFVRTGMKL